MGNEKLTIRRRVTGRPSKELRDRYTPASISLTLNSAAAARKPTETATAFQITSTYNATLTLGFAIDSASFVQATDIPVELPSALPLESSAHPAAVPTG